MQFIGVEVMAILSQMMPSVMIDQPDKIESSLVQRMNLFFGSSIVAGGRR
jgi:hypothetical protein